MTMNSNDTADLMAQFETGCDAFNRKDIDGYFHGVHPSAWTYQAGTFMSLATMRDAAPAILAASGRFKVACWLAGVITGDSGVVWGEYEHEPTAGGHAPLATGSFSAHYVRVDDEWQVLFTHYTPVEMATTGS
jgi:hypothetical protein